MGRTNTGTGVDIHDLSRVVLSQSPLSAISFSFTFQYRPISKAKPVIAVCHIQPIVHTPD